MTMEDAGHSAEPTGNEISRTLSTERRQEIVGYIEMTMRGKIEGLQITFQDDQLILTGSSPSYYLKQLATHAAIDAVVTDFAVQNMIEVG